MITNIIKAPPKVWLALLAPLLLAFVTNPEQAPQQKPKIRKQEFKNFVLYDQALQLEQHTVTEFNQAGKVVQFAEYETNGQLQRLRLHKYDQNGNQIGTMLYNSTNALVWSEDIYYDDQSRIKTIEQIEYQNEQKKSRTLYEYDQYGNRAVMKTFVQEEQTSEQRRMFNIHGELIESYDWIFLQQEGGKSIKKTTRNTNEYDQKGHLIRSVSDVQEGKRKWREVRSFRNGFLTSLYRYEGNKIVSQFEVPQRDTSNLKDYLIEPPLPMQEPILEYDDQKRDPLANIPHVSFREIEIKTDKYGNYTKKIIREYGEITAIIEYEYDKNQNLVREKRINKQDPSEEIVIYTYDKYHNITEESTYFDKEVIAQKVFNYEYY